jgi:hypothetical protein
MMRGLRTAQRMAVNIGINALCQTLRQQKSSL